MPIIEPKAHTLRFAKRTYRDQTPPLLLTQASNRPHTIPSSVKAFFHSVDKRHQALLKESDHYTDFYFMEGELLNQFISIFPHMKDAWDKLTIDEKWLFVEGVHYAIRPLVREGIVNRGKNL
jgi:hypothetical protein